MSRLGGQMERAETPNRQVGKNFGTSRSASFYHSLRFLSLTISFLGALLGENISKSYAQESEGQRFAEPYVSAFITRSHPTSGTYSYQEDQIPSLSIGSETGGGFKVGAYARPYNYAIGAELEGFIHGGTLSAPQTTISGVTRFANQDFTMVNGMVNILARYRGDFIQPYVGGGVGLTGVFTDGPAQSAGGLQSGSHGLLGFAAQAIAGARLVVTQHIYFFAEYKYLMSYSELDHCESEKENDNCRVLNQLNYQSHYTTVGIGFSF